MYARMYVYESRRFRVGSVHTIHGVPPAIFGEGFAPVLEMCSSHCFTSIREFVRLYAAVSR
jgi:hypothetical protein